ncbi:hypothetical protein AYI83_18570 [Shewanella algae]|nr:hypothetical protein AYI83_18570 [Shewanella algae]TVO80377.1 hypothetical protein AYI78_19700 [Shewanella algae]TVO90807.1 hypothetical protein AYI79_19860 [Shewanella algae]
MKNDFSHVINDMNSELVFGKLSATITNIMGHCLLLALMDLYGRNLQGRGTMSFITAPKPLRQISQLAGYLGSHRIKQATLRWLG